MNELIRKPGNVFVDIKDLNEVSPVTPIEALYSDGSNFEVTPEPESTLVKAVASAEEVRIYRINPNGKRHHILTEPSWTPETDTFCQMHSDVTECASLRRTMRCSTRYSNPRTRLNVRPIRRFPIRSKPLRKRAADLAGLTILIAVAWAAFMVL